MAKLLKVTVDLITASTVEDVYIALASLSPIKQTVSTDELPNGKHNPKGVRGPYKKTRTTHQHDNDGVPLHKRPVKYTDQRLVWDERRNCVDVDATLNIIGLTRKDIDVMTTRQGSIEHTLKRAMRGRGY